MKILMTADTAGGVWHYAIDLARVLMEGNITVILVAMGSQPNKAQLEQVKKNQKCGMAFYHRPYKLEWMDDPWKDVAQANQWIKEIVDQEKPDLLHFNNYAQVGLGWDIPSVLVVHSCVATWWHAVKREQLPEKYSHYFQMVKKALNSADTVVFPSKGMLDICQDVYGKVNNPEVVYNGLADTFEPLSEFSIKMPILFSMGRLWDEAKNVNLLLDAAPQIRGEIFIAGAKTQNFDCPKNVTFLGELTRQQIFNWLKMSAIYVLPVKYEPFGLSFLEAASCRCALIGGDIPTLREIWGKSMTYIAPENAKELASACNNLLLDEALCRIKGDEAHQRAKNFPIIKKKNHYLEIYSQHSQKVA